MYEQWGEAPFVNPAHAGGETSPTGEYGSGEYAGSTEFGESAFLTPEANAEAHASVDRWAETLGEQPWGQRPSGEAGEAGWPGENEFGEAAFGEGKWNETNSAGEGEWGEFAGETMESGEWTESGVGEFAELGEDEWGGPATPTLRGQVGGACSDTTWNRQPWRVSRPGRHTTVSGSAISESVARRAHVRELTLTDFDVDNYRLRPAHRAALAQLADQLAAGVRSGRLSMPIDLRIRGSASSTGTDRRNFELSRHRAWNVRSALLCLLQQSGLVDGVRTVWTPVGEGVSQMALGDSRESSEFRGVKVLVVAPVRSCGCASPSSPTLPGPPGLRLPFPTPGPGRYGPYRPGTVAAPRGGGGMVPSSRTLVTASLCFSLTSLRRSPGAPPLLRLVPGLPGVVLPSAIAPVARARLTVTDHRRRRSAVYEVRGVALVVRGGTPQQLVGRIGGSLAAMLRAPQLRIPSFLGGRMFSVAGRVVADAMRRISTTGRCQPVGARSLRGHPATRLGGPAVLVLPATGVGQPLLHLSRGALSARGVVLRRRPVPVSPGTRSSRSTIVLIGVMRRVPVAGYRMMPEINEWEMAGEATASLEFGERQEHGEFGELGELNELGEFGEFGEAANEFAGEFGQESHAEVNAEFSNEFANELANQSVNEFAAEFGNEFSNEFANEVANEDELVGEWANELNEWTELGAEVP